MNSLVMTVLLHVSILSSGPQDYSNAQSAALKNGEPLLVMVGATWCPACARMKSDVIPGLQRSGAFQSVHFAQVDIDEEHELAGRLSSASVIPQLILYRKTAAGWRRWETTGGQSATAVQEFLRNGTTDQAKDSRAQVTRR